MKINLEKTNDPISVQKPSGSERTEYDLGLVFVKDVPCCPAAGAGVAECRLHGARVPWTRADSAGDMMVGLEKDLYDLSNLYT